MAELKHTGLEGAGAKRPIKVKLRNVETNEIVEVYNIDAQDYRKQKTENGQPLWSSDLAPGRLKGKPAKNVDKVNKEPESEDVNGDEPTWEDWSNLELLAVAKELKIRKASEKSRTDLLKAIEEKGGKPDDSKPVLPPSEGDGEGEEE